MRVMGDLVGEVSYRFSLTDLGRSRGKTTMEQCAYVGPAPVPLEDYVEQCYRQTVTGLQCYPEALKAPFGHLVLKEEMFNNIGPAIISGRSVFIYGPPGNGKTAMARAIGDFMNTAGGSLPPGRANCSDNCSSMRVNDVSKAAITRGTTPSRPSGSSSRKVRSAPASEPASGSVRPNAPSFALPSLSRTYISPAWSLGRYQPFMNSIACSAPRKNRSSPVALATSKSAAAVPA